MPNIKRAFFTSTKNLSSSDRINYLKAKTKYLSTINLAQTYANPPETNIYEKSKLITYNGPYKLTANYNDLSVVNNYCLSQSRSYTDLLDITKGKYLINPPATMQGGITTENINASEIYNANFFVYNSNNQVIMKYDNSVNTVDSETGHIYMDPSYNIYYNGNYPCYDYNNGYYRYVTINTSLEAQAYEHKFALKNYLQGFSYPIKFNLDCPTRSTNEIVNVEAMIITDPNGMVMVIRLLDNSVLRQILVGDDPRQIVRTNNNTFAYVTNFGSENVSLISLTNLSLVSMISVGINPWGIAISPNQNFVYVANYGSNNVSVINVWTNVVDATISVQTNPIGIAVTPDSARVFVVNHGSDSVTVIDANSNTVITNILLLGSPSTTLLPSYIAITPNGLYAYVTATGNNRVYIINVETREVIGNIEVGNEPNGIVIKPNGSYAYVANTGSSTVSVINLQNNIVENTFNSPNPYSFIMSQNGKFLYTSNYANKYYSVINTVNNITLNTINNNISAYGGTIFYLTI